MAAPDTDGFECVICLIGEREGTEVGKIGCGHTFCVTCIELWGKTSNSCPLCKERFYQIMVIGDADRVIIVPDADLRMPDPGVDVSYLETVVCFRCSSGHDDANLLLCDGCDRACHTFCCDVPMTVIPDDDWFCPPCRATEHFTSPRRQDRTVRRTRVRGYSQRAAAVPVRPGRRNVLEDDDDDDAPPPVPQPSSQVTVRRAARARAARAHVARSLVADSMSEGDDESTGEDRRRERRRAAREAAGGGGGAASSSGDGSRRRQRRQRQAEEDEDEIECDEEQSDDASFINDGESSSSGVDFASTSSSSSVRPPTRSKRKAPAAAAVRRKPGGSSVAAAAVAAATRSGEWLSSREPRPASVGRKRAMLADSDSDEWAPVTVPTPATAAAAPARASAAVVSESGDFEEDQPTVRPQRVRKPPPPPRQQQQQQHVPPPRTAVGVAPKIRRSALSRPSLGSSGGSVLRPAGLQVPPSQPRPRDWSPPVQAPPQSRQQPHDNDSDSHSSSGSSAAERALASLVGSAVRTPTASLRLRETPEQSPRDPMPRQDAVVVPATPAAPAPRPLSESPVGNGVVVGIKRRRSSRPDGATSPRKRHKPLDRPSAHGEPQIRAPDTPPVVWPRAVGVSATAAAAAAVDRVPETQEIPASGSTTHSKKRLKLSEINNAFHIPAPIPEVSVVSRFFHPSALRLESDDD